MIPGKQPFQGHTRKLALAFDVGNRYSKVSYCILDPGEIPTIHGVTRYPAQEHLGGDDKIPSIIYYDQQHVVRAVGTEALQQHIIDQAKDENWTKLEWRKIRIYLHAGYLSSSFIKGNDIPPLPRGLSAIQVLSDFMKYLFKCARKYIVESHASGSSVWRSLENQVEFVLTHPNRWEGRQQQRIRRAAVLAGLVPVGEDGQSRLHLLTEGEANLHFCVTTSDAFSTTPVVYLDEPEEPNNHPGYQGIAVIDAGSATVDINVYSLTFSPSVSVEEIAPAECLLRGSICVTRRAKRFLKSKLTNSRYGTPEIVEHMTEQFDKSIKFRFRSAEDPQYIKFGTVRDRDPDYDIRSGQLKIPGNEVAEFFEPSVEAIANVFKTQQGRSALPIKHAFLIGEFAASDFLFMGLQRHPAFMGVTLSRPWNHVVAKFTYGVTCSPRYLPSRADHLARKHTTYCDATGHLRVPGSFRSILAKGTRVSEQQEFFYELTQRDKTPSGCSQISIKVRAYRGKYTVPGWLDEDPGSFTELCTIHADMSKVTSLLPQRRSKTGETYYSIHFKVILLFGVTELKAQLSWLENGVEKRSPASISYGD
ncbi:hypothetical protein V8B97DRAFT_1918464 [Scleroderma yunnanense]